MNLRLLRSKVLAQRREFFSFIAIGMLNTCFGYCIYAFMIFMGFKVPVALLVTFASGVGFNFVTFGKLVFKSLDWSRAPHFLAIYSINYVGAVWLISEVQHHINPSPYIAYLIVMPFSVAFLYFALRRFAFAGRVKKAISLGD